MMKPDIATYAQRLGGIFLAASYLTACASVTAPSPDNQQPLETFILSEQWITAIADSAAERPQWVGLGERHGTQESPEFFKTLRDEWLAQGLTVTVMIEGDQHWNTVLSPQPTDEENRLMVCTEMNNWMKFSSIDGRASEAMADLLISSLTITSNDPNMVEVRFFDRGFEPNAFWAQHLDNDEGTSLYRDISYRILNNRDDMDIDMERHENMALHILDALQDSDIVLSLNGALHPPMIDTLITAQADSFEELPFDITTIRQVYDGGSAWVLTRNGIGPTDIETMHDPRSLDEDYPYALRPLPQDAYDFEIIMPTATTSYPAFVSYLCGDDPQSRWEEMNEQLEDMGLPAIEPPP